MKKKMIITTAALVFALAGVITTNVEAAKNRAAKTPQVEVVFVLDTTGSMGGLIEGAKLKIWSIANQIVKGSPRPDIKVGLVGYRDKGDQYVTRVFDLSSDLDEVYAELMSYQAGGGGDGPEHVNRALHDAVNDVTWSTDARTLRILFLVGDAPPHVDYNDGYDYKTICKQAVSNDIIVNTVQCGAMGGTEDYWREIARLGEGEYAAIPQTGGMRSITTPMDGEISRLSVEMRSTVVAWGSADEIAKKERDDAMVEAMPAEAKASRAAVRSASGAVTTYDLIDGIESGRVELDKVESKDLPEEMRPMSLEQKQEYLKEKTAQRDEIRKKLSNLNRQRDEFVKAKIAEGNDGNPDSSFDAQVLGMIRTQASVKGITY